MLPSFIIYNVKEWAKTILFYKFATKNTTINYYHILKIYWNQLVLELKRNSGLRKANYNT